LDVAPVAGGTAIRLAPNPASHWRRVSGSVAVSVKFPVIADLG
jgi:hypothetical protein